MKIFRMEFFCEIELTKIRDRLSSIQKKRLTQEDELEYELNQYEKKMRRIFEVFFIDFLK
jgi:hypothetical protein